ncbi:MAG TPA: UbiA family prenyltransferase [Edaphocola sp.]|nr:UbiA family prenyltransferase [Edaphocola sp.]
MNQWEVFKAKTVELIFFGNYFYALCVVSLAIESSMQQSIALNNVYFYIFLASSTIAYYTYAYQGKIHLFFFEKSSISLLPENYVFRNPRTRWYHRNQKLIGVTQTFFIFLVLISALVLIIFKFKDIFSLKLYEWLLLLSTPFVAGLYYGKGIFPKLKFDLRKTGWLKPFVIGFVWAMTVSIYPVMFHEWELHRHFEPDFFSFWLFVKNFMYISVLAIMFDIKDYVDDANQGLKTFVVRVGLRKTIFYIILPLTVIGLLAFTIFAFASSFSLGQYLFNLIPFVLLLFVTYNFKKRKSIFYYLAIIDGLMLLKGVCGIVAVLIFNPQ